jgi:putative secretion ATPase (PEP-CTERM system associated)
MYTDYYGLTAPPFQLTPDARFWFASGTHKKAMAYLGYGLAQGEGFIVVTGDIGAGKTTLTGHLMETIDPARVEAIRIVSTQVEGDDMLRLTAQGLGLPTEGVEKAQLLDRIERHLTQTGRGARRTLLIIDEAQNLPTSALEELRMLSNFQAGGDALLQIFLLGQPEFRDRLADSDQLEQLRQRVIATHHLDPMAADETRGYLEHRLKTAGWTGRPALTGEACALLHTASGGLPRKLNTLATRALLMAAIDKLDTIDDAVISQVVSDLDGDRPKATAPVGAAPMDPLLAANMAHQPPEPDTRASDARMNDYEVRIALLETQIQEQDAALRRVLTLLIDWVERDEPALARAPAA